MKRNMLEIRGEMTTTHLSADYLKFGRTKMRSQSVPNCWRQSSEISEKLNGQTPALENEANETI